MLSTLFNLVGEYFGNEEEPRSQQRQNNIIEAIESIQRYQTERKESERVGMILPVLDSVNLAIGQKNLVLFKHSYASLTNACRRATDFGFNKVKVSNTQPFSNQDFRVKMKE